MCEVLYREVVVFQFQMVSDPAFTSEFPISCRTKLLYSQHLVTLDLYDMDLDLDICSPLPGLLQFESELKRFGFTGLNQQILMVFLLLSVRLNGGVCVSVL